MELENCKTNSLAGMLGLHFSLAQETTGSAIKTTEYSYHVYPGPYTEIRLAILNDHIKNHGVPMFDQEGMEVGRIYDIQLSKDMVAEDPVFVFQTIQSIRFENPALVDGLEILDNDYRVK